MHKRWLLLGATLLMAVLAFAFVACGDDEDEEEGETPTAEATAPLADETPAETPAEGETPVATEPGGEAETTPSAATVIVSEHSELGSILTDAEGRTLYTFAEDEPNVSSCQNDPCPQTWPPLTIEAGTPVAGAGVPGELGVIERQDGSSQVTYNGMPLHRFTNDREPGDANGQGIGGLWYVIQVSD